MHLPITKRLVTAAEMIGDADILCDVGCDHGYLPIYLIQKGQIKEAYACDVRDGPLKTASKNISAYHMKDTIRTIKSNGLSELGAVAFDVISICGMGGRLIAEIIKQDIQTARRAKRMVLQPMSEIPALRRFLAENGFLIQEERLAVEDRRFYVLMTVVCGEEINRSEVDYVLGRLLLGQKDKVTQAHFKKELQRFQTVLEARGGSGKAPELVPIVEELKKYAENII